MTDATERLLQDALSLSDPERAELAARLIESLDMTDDANSADIEDAWAAEIERRCAALDAGDARTIAWEDVRRQIAARLQRG